MTILLMGVLGSGKSSVAQILAKQRSISFVEMDTLVQQTLGVSDPSSVPEHLWKECQIDVCKDLSVQDSMVIAASGNIVDNDINLLYFRLRGDALFVVYLSTDLDTLVSRTVSERHQNPAQVKEKLKTIVEMRDPLYRKFADLVVDTDDKTPQQIADHILHALT